VIFAPISSSSNRRPWVVMLLENNPFPQDSRVQNEARSLVAAGYRVTVVAPRADGQPRYEVIGGIDVRRFRLRSATGGVGALVAEFVVAWWMLHLAALRALILGADVLHLHNPPDTLFPAGWAARLLGRCVIFDHHDLTPELVASRTQARWAIPLARWCERRTFRIASVVLSSNQSYAEIARLRGGKKPEDVVVVRNAPRAEELSRGAEIRPGVLSDPRLVYVGAIAPQDDAEDLPVVLSLLRDRHGIPNARLTIVGDGPARGAVIAAARRQNVADQVTITGWLDSREVPSIIREADVCVDPAHPTPLNDRSTMIKIGEYLAAGRPVVAYALTETQRTAADAVSLAGRGDPTCFAECVAVLAKDEGLRRRAAERACGRALELTWERSEQELLRAYDSLCGVT
jgi:glycosyltransferase involved in cell wall biosynthesis